MRCFVPIRDDVILQYPQLLLELVPYRADQPCFHWEAEIVTCCSTCRFDGHQKRSCDGCCCADIQSEL